MLNTYQDRIYMNMTNIVIPGVYQKQWYEETKGYVIL